MKFLNGNIKMNLMYGSYCLQCNDIYAVVTETVIFPKLLSILDKILTHCDRSKAYLRSSKQSENMYLHFPHYIKA